MWQRKKSESPTGKKIESPRGIEHISAHWTEALATERHVVSRGFTRVIVTCLMHTSVLIGWAKSKASLGDDTERKHLPNENIRWGWIRKVMKDFIFCCDCWKKKDICSHVRSRKTYCMYSNIPPPTALQFKTFFLGFYVQGNANSDNSVSSRILCACRWLLEWTLSQKPVTFEH